MILTFNKLNRVFYMIFSSLKLKVCLIANLNKNNNTKKKIFDNNSTIIKFW